jgi:6-phosphofructokinase 2
MIITVTLNPCIDKSSRVEKMKPESKLRCSEVVHEPGGGGINVSKALKKLDTHSMALFPAGGYNGAMLRSLLTKEKLDYHAVETHVETRENWIVLETSANNQFRFTFPGLSVEERAIIELIDAIKSFSPSYLVASGSLPPGLPPYFYGLLVKTANALGAQCIVDTSGEALEALRGRNAFLIKPNIGELCNLLGEKFIEAADVPHAARQVLRNGFAEMAAVSMGPVGAWLVTKSEQMFVPAPDVPKRSTVGAGDSMVAGITYMLQRGGSLLDALCMGVACGSAATMNEGSQLFNPEDAFALYHLVRQKA